jgi:hypothetical protein
LTEATEHLKERQNRKKGKSNADNEEWGNGLRDLEKMIWQLREELDLKLPRYRGGQG